MKPETIAPRTNRSRIAVRACALSLFAVTFGVAASQRQAPSAGAEFSRAAVSLLEAGWTIRKLELDDSRRASFEVAIVFAREDEARRLQLMLPADGSAPTSFAQAEVAVPELRIYPGEARLREALASGAVAGIDTGCDEYLLVIGLSDHPMTVTFEPTDYYVPVETVRGGRAGSLAARAVIDAVDGGMALVRLSHRAGDAELVFADATEELSVHLERDPAGGVVLYELRASPSRPIGEHYRPERQIELIRAMKANPIIDRVTWRPRRVGTDGSPGLELGLRGGPSVFLAWADFIDVATDSHP